MVAHNLLLELVLDQILWIKRLNTTMEICGQMLLEVSQKLLKFK